MSTGATPYISLYERRVELVAAEITKHSTLGHAEAVDLARHILRALDHIPERMR